MIDCKNEKSSNKIAIILIAVIVLALIAAFLPTRKAADTQSGMTDTPSTPAAKPLSTYWTEGSTVAQSLTEYVTKVTNPDDAANFIPVEDRSAVLTWTAR